MTHPCLDAEMMAAWIDGGLPDDARLAVERHVADCARCQAVMAAIVRTTPGEAREDAPAPTRRWLGWLVPAAAAAAALVVWMVVPRAPDQATPTQMTARAEPPLSPPATRDLVDQVPPPAEMAKSTAPPAELDRTTTSREALTTMPQANEAQRERRAEAADAVARRADTVAAAEAASAPAVQPSAVSPPAAAPAPTPPAAGAGSSALREEARAARRQYATSRPLVPGIASPDGTVFWRFYGSTIERSNDSVFWDTVFTGPGLTLTAGSAPAATVCWIVGRQGVVLRAIDGKTFVRVMSPSQSDLLVVRASDAQSASVTTIDGRTFETADGGTTWK